MVYIMDVSKNVTIVQYLDLIYEIYVKANCVPEKT